jgi:hypothetical protein
VQDDDAEPSNLAGSAVALQSPEASAAGIGPGVKVPAALTSPEVAAPVTAPSWWRRQQQSYQEAALVRR